MNRVTEISFDVNKQPVTTILNSDLGAGELEIIVHDTCAAAWRSDQPEPTVNRIC